MVILDLMKKKTQLCLGLVLLACLLGCGQKGPLKPADPNVQAKQQLEAMQPGFAAKQNS